MMQIPYLQLIPWSDALYCLKPLRPFDDCKLSAVLGRASKRVRRLSRSVRMLCCCGEGGQRCTAALAVFDLRGLHWLHFGAVVYGSVI